MLKRSLVKLSAALAFSALSFASQAADITGAGATFPYPIFAKWAEVYKKTENVGLNYQSIGSSGGLRQRKLTRRDPNSQRRAFAQECLAGPTS